MTDIDDHLLVAELISRCLDLGLSSDELMVIVTGEAQEVSMLLDAVANSSIETRSRHLLELAQMVREVCGDRAEVWLREPNPTLGLRSPVQTLLHLPAALESMAHLLRSLRRPEQLLH